MCCWTLGWLFDFCILGSLIIWCNNNLLCLAVWWMTISQGFCHLVQSVQCKRSNLRELLGGCLCIGGQWYWFQHYWRWILQCGQWIFEGFVEFVYGGVCSMPSRFLGRLWHWPCWCLWHEWQLSKISSLLHLTWYLRSGIKPRKYWMVLGTASDHPSVGWWHGWWLEFGDGWVNLLFWLVLLGFQVGDPLWVGGLGWVAEELVHS